MIIMASSVAVKKVLHNIDGRPLATVPRPE